MDLFSFRNKITTPDNTIQLETASKDLRIGIWNVLEIHLWKKYQSDYLDTDAEFKSLFIQLWVSYFKFNLNTLSNLWRNTYTTISRKFSEFEWYEIYNFIEFVLANSPMWVYQEDLINDLNEVLQREFSGYRVIDNLVVQITSESEINEISEAIEGSSSSSKTHLQTALKLLSDKKRPDYRNSIKESISAVESLCREISEDKKAELGKALSKIKNTGKVQIHGALQSAFTQLYGYTSDSSGIRHSLLEESNLDFEDAKFMLVSCSAFINYLIVKADKAGITLKSNS
jgi:hypothetical protein